MGWRIDLVRARKMSEKSPWEPPRGLRTWNDDSDKQTVPMMRHTNIRGNGMDIGKALETMKTGGRVARVGWNGRNMWLAMQSPDANSKMTLPYIYMFTAQGDLVPWLASQTDLLATDWEVVP